MKLAKSFPWQSIHNDRYQGAQKCVATRQLERRKAMFKPGRQGSKENLGEEQRGEKESTKDGICV